MAQRIVLICDACGSDSEVQNYGPFDLGDGLRSPDLCPECVVALHVDRIIALATEYGAAPDAVVGAGGKTYSSSYSTEGQACPICRIPIKGTRTSVIGHLRRAHDMDIGAASKLLPIDGPSETCKVCGYEGSTRGGGMRLHVKAHEERGESKGKVA